MRLRYFGAFAASRIASPRDNLRPHRAMPLSRSLGGVVCLERVEQRHLIDGLRQVALEARGPTGLSMLLLHKSSDGDHSARRQVGQIAQLPG